MTSANTSGPDWVQAVGHACRVEIIRRFLAMGTATPSDIAIALKAPLGTVSYHVRWLAKAGVIRLAGRTQRRGASVRHYQLTDRERAASILWGIRATLLVTDFERQNGRADVSASLDSEALAELHDLTGAYLARIGELGLQTRERQATEDANHDTTPIAVMLAIGEHGASITAGRQ